MLRAAGGQLAIAITVPATDAPLAAPTHGTERYVGGGLRLVDLGTPSEVADGSAADAERAVAAARGAYRRGDWSRRGSSVLSSSWATGQQGSKAHGSNQPYQTGQTFHGAISTQKH